MHVTKKPNHVLNVRKFKLKRKFTAYLIVTIKFWRRCKFHTAVCYCLKICSKQYLFLLPLMAFCNVKFESNCVINKNKCTPFCQAVSYVCFSW